MTRSLIRMKSAARLTGSISVSAARQSRSDSSFRHRARLAPGHVFAVCGPSQEQTARRTLPWSVDARPGAGLLDDRLDLLTTRLIDGLEQHLGPRAVLRADPIGTSLPAASIEQSVGLLDVELPPRIRRCEGPAVHEVRGRGRPTTPGIPLNPPAIDQHSER